MQRHSVTLPASILQVFDFPVVNKLPPIPANLALVVFLTASVLASWSTPEFTPIFNPDSIEYITSAENLIAGEGLQVSLRGEYYPVRYQPGFPVLFVAPWLLLDGEQPAIGIYSIVLASIGILLVCWVICRRLLPGLHGIAAAFVSLILVLELAQFEQMRKLIMSDVPAFFLSLSAVLVFLQCCRHPSAWWRYLLAGSIISVAISMRVSNLALCLPFLVPMSKCVGRRELPVILAAFSLPLAVTVTALLYYNYTMFGHPLYTGYHYWLSAISYSLSPLNVARTIPEMLHPFHLPHWRTNWFDWWIGPALLAMPLLTGWLCRRLNPPVWADSKPMVYFLASYGLVTITFFALYPFPDSRFLLTVYAAWFILGAVWAGAILKALPTVVKTGVVVSLAALSMWLHLPASASGVPYINALLNRMNTELPGDAVIIGTIPELVADRFLLRDNNRQYVPLERTKSLETWKVGRSGETRRSIGIASVQTRPGQVADHISRGRPVYVISQQSRWSGHGRHLDALRMRFDNRVVFEMYRRDALIQLLRCADTLVDARHNDLPFRDVRLTHNPGCHNRQD